jgi:hypothetical protein
MPANRGGMVEKLREILLTRYIGSILIALLCWQALISVIEKLVQIVVWVINDQRAHASFESTHASFPWDSLILAAVDIALYLVTAYTLARWLYPSEALPSAPPLELEEDLASLRPPEPS